METSSLKVSIKVSNVPPEILKATSPVTSASLNQTYNNTLETTIFPSVKTTTVSPHHKGNETI